MDPTIVMARAEDPQDVGAVGELFLDYAAFLDFDLGFQNFDNELRSLPGDYAPPFGCLLLLRYNGEPAGCGALRRFNRTTCEMKRLYVKPGFRGQGYGRKLAEELIRRAKEMGYSRMVLDTIRSMHMAIWLYTSLGFTEILPYRYNPVPGARFFALDLES